MSMPQVETTEQLHARAAFEHIEQARAKDPARFTGPESAKYRALAASHSKPWSDLV